MRVLKGISWKPFVDVSKAGWVNMSIAFFDEKPGKRTREEDVETIDFMVHEKVIQNILPKLSKTLEHINMMKRGEEVKLDKKEITKVESKETNNSMFG